MAWSERFFTKRRLTSKLKHLVLQRYVKEYAYHLGSRRPIVYYVDGFAGAGAYEDENANVHEDGSPLLIARLAEQIKGWPRPFELRCLNVESNKKRFISLQKATEPYRPQIIQKNFRSTFIEALPEILQLIRDAPSFFFIDPFGAKDIPFRDLRPVFNRHHRTEALITVQTDGFSKKAGWFRYENDPDPTEREKARKFTQHLAAMLGIEHSKLRDGWLETGAVGNTTAFENRLVAYYRRRLHSSATQFTFTKQFKVLYYNPVDPSGTNTTFFV